MGSGRLIEKTRTLFFSKPIRSGPVSPLEERQARSQQHEVMSLIRIRGASQHNLKDVSLDFPRQALTVFTGVSGSGKSSLAFDTVCREGQRRFLESLPAYARQFLGPLEKAKVESVDGLSPTISIDQKTVHRSPRSTVGTITDLSDYLRLLMARLGTPHCPSCGKVVAAQTVDRICDRLLAVHSGRRLLLCAPLVRARKGSYRRLLEDQLRSGFLRMRIDGEIVRLAEDSIPELARNEAHDISIVYDRLEVQPARRGRLVESVEKCCALSGGLLEVVEFEPSPDQPAEVLLFSSHLACPDCEVDLPELEPRLFSFNSAQGACTACDGLGETDQLDPELLVADPSRPFGQGGLTLMLRSGKLLGGPENTHHFRELGERYGFSHRHSWGDLSEEARAAFLDGDEHFIGFVELFTRALESEQPSWLQPLVRARPCRECQGARLGAVARSVRIRGKAVQELSAMPLDQLREWLVGLEFSAEDAPVAEPILKGLESRLRYLVNVGLSYLAMDRRGGTLAGGEAQRLRLASQVGGGLRGVLYVLDEPSIGLHPCDNERLIETLITLRDAGNTVLVVEHDRATMARADMLVDVGPGAGPQGGEIVAQGDGAALAREPTSVTGAYLSGARRIEVPSQRRPRGEAVLALRGVTHNNLRDVDLELPLGLFVVITGVSGSGKSSLVNQVLQPALNQRLGHSRAPAGAHRALTGYTQLDKVVSIDQAPIGRSPRSNPATYVKLFDLMRELFSQVPEARSRGYRAARFSFNKDGGRCLECGGAGALVVEMQFLAPVTVVCDACGGRRYNRETLEIRYRGKSIFDVLEMTVGEAVRFFEDLPKIYRTLEWLDRVGLGYMRIGQASTTLSGGEAQRVKLAGELRKRDTGRTLYLLDEPTTGLHFEDIRTLLAALQELVDRGNTVLVVEHNTDVMKVADHIVDLGPGPGEAGGEVVAQGTPEEVSRVAASATAPWIREALDGEETLVDSSRSPVTKAPAGGDEQEFLSVRGARQHNLQAVDVDFPLQALSVVTGVSGSGKTSLAFDTLFAEGQRRYLESLSTYARRFLRQIGEAPVDSLTGLSPAIAIDQKSVSLNPRSTVATITEIHDYLRLLYARVATPHCPQCGGVLESTSPTRLAARLVASLSGEKAYVLAPLRSALAEFGGAQPLDTRKLMDRLERLRSDLVKRGFTRLLAVGHEFRLDADDGDPVYGIVERINAALRDRDPPRERYGVDGEHLELGGALIEVVVDRVVVKDSAQTRLADSLSQAFELGEGEAGFLAVGGDPRYYFRHPTCAERHFQFREDLSPRMFSFSSHQGACERCRGLGVEKRADVSRLVPRPDLPLLAALDRRFREFLQARRPSQFRVLLALCQARGIEHETLPFGSYRPADRDAILEGAGVDTITVPMVGGSEIEATWSGLAPALENWVHNEAANAHRAELEPLLRSQTCSICEGGRLRPEFLAVRLGRSREGAAADPAAENGAPRQRPGARSGGLNIQEFNHQTVAEALAFLHRLSLPENLATIAAEVLRELIHRLQFLERIGLSYLTLDRPASTLSGGEAQRIRLASQLGNRLAGVLYVLDEPTVGLHPRDTDRLLESLRGLQELGNTLVVVEHDREVMSQADWLVDIGPGPGRRGGRLVACGTPRDVAAHPDSVTGLYLRGEKEVGARHRSEGARCLEGERPWLRFKGVEHNNLKGVDVGFPLAAFTVVTGVSGSGKSSLVVDVLGETMAAYTGKRPLPELFESISGHEHIERFVVVDQRPLGRSPRSNAATYTGAWTAVRELFAALPECRTKGWGPARFSFNVGDGRCAACEGQGAKEVEMHFLSDVWVPCDECRGRRFNRETLGVHFKGRNIAEVLDLEVDAACEFFENHPKIRPLLESMRDVGLGYLRLGQPASTLSGGEAQRLKLSRELAAKSERRTLYVLDEPTTGLHFEDIDCLLGVLRRLVARGNTLIAIEHHLDVIRAADWVIDLGPEAGAGGGRVVAATDPEGLRSVAESETGRCLNASSAIFQ